MQGYNIEKLKHDMAEMGISLSETQIGQFLRYYEMLTEWNEKINLTAITEYEDVLKKHFVDSLSLVKAVDLNCPATVIDVGTGAGFPGLVLKIAFPGLQVTLLDSLQKRVHFLRAVIEGLQLTGAEVVHGRAEDCARSEELRERFDLCVSRAVANLSTLSEYCIPFVKKGGAFVAYKSEKAAQELDKAQRAISFLGGIIEKKEEFTLPDSDICRSLIVIRKVKNTPVKYPRKAGLPSREPLE